MQSKRLGVLLAMCLSLSVAIPCIAWAVPPTIEKVTIKRILRVDGPGSPRYDQEITVQARDEDGAADTLNLQVEGGGMQFVSTCPYLNTSESECDENGLNCKLKNWTRWGNAMQPPSGDYTVTVTDIAGESATLTFSGVPAMRQTPSTTLLAPASDAIFDTVQDPNLFTPIFTFNKAASEVGNIHVWAEGMPYDEVWNTSIEVGPNAAVTYNESNTAAAGYEQIIPGTTYYWSVWVGPSSPVFVVKDTAGVVKGEVYDEERIWRRFYVKGTPPMAGPLPTLDGKFTYLATLCGNRSSSSLVRYTNNNTTRSWLGPLGLWSADWSWDGTNLLYTKPPWIFADKLDGSTPTQVPGTKAADRWGRWSPDARHVVYERWIPGVSWCETADIWIADMAGGAGHALVNSPDLEWCPVWSPDGLWIAYTRRYPGGNSSVRLVRYDGTYDHALSITGIAGSGSLSTILETLFPAWSPDGKKLAVSFTANVGGSMVYGIGTVAAEGGQLLPIFVAPPNADNYCCLQPYVQGWSPDGKKVVFLSSHHNPSTNGCGNAPFADLWMVAADTMSSVPQQLTYDFMSQPGSSWWAPNTPVGTNVTVVKGDNAITFEKVTIKGSTRIAVKEDAPALPKGFAVLGYHKVSAATTATRSGKITISCKYSDMEVPSGREDELLLLEWRKVIAIPPQAPGRWGAVTIGPSDTVNNLIKGEVWALSTYAIAVGPQIVPGVPPIPIEKTPWKAQLPAKFKLIAADGAALNDADVLVQATRVNQPNLPPKEVKCAFNANTGYYSWNPTDLHLSVGTWKLRLFVNGIAIKEAKVLIP